MKELVELVEALLIYAAAYPATLWNLIFAPSNVLTPTLPDRVCPSSIAYLFTVIIGYYRIRIMSLKSNSANWPEIIDAKFVVVSATLYVAVIVNLQQLAIGLVRPMSIPLAKQLVMLLYPASLLFLSLFLMSELTIRDDRWITPALILAHAAYLVSLLNICRVGFALEMPQALIATAAAYGVILGIAFVAMGIISSYEKRHQAA